MKKPLPTAIFVLTQTPDKRSGKVDNGVHISCSTLIARGIIPSDSDSPPESTNNQYDEP